MGFPQSSRAYADMQRPEAWGCCDRCGFRYLHRELNWQFDWRGNQLQNLRILVCRPCTDLPQEQLRPIIIGPDPVPIRDPRPGYAATQMQGGSPLIPPAINGFITDDFGEVITDDSGAGFLSA
jgi:hypothetical protein